MSKFDEYINGLEGQTEIDPLKIAQDLHSLYTEDIGTREAKITELTGTIAEKDSAFSNAQAELQAQKAKNFDLAMQIPGAQVNPASDNEEEDLSGPLTVDDLFVK